MRLDAVTAEIRPRSDWEAVDLGFAMIRRGFWRCWVLWWLAMAAPLLVGGFFLWDHPLVLAMLIWWMKPAALRMVLFDISRRLFGEEPIWKSIFREIPRAWCRRFFYRFIWARFSPWLVVTMAVEDLEGLRGKDYKLRCNQVVKRGEGVVMWVYFMSEFAVLWLMFALAGLLFMFIPSGQGTLWWEAVQSWDVRHPFEIPALISQSVAICMIFAMSLVDVFAIGAGFGVYINNRTWLEGWDVELAFKRLASRLAKVALVFVCFFAVTGTVRAQEPKEANKVVASETIRQVKESPEYEVHKIIQKVPKGNSGSTKKAPDIVMWIFIGMSVVTVIIFLAFIGWMIWKHRHIFQMRFGGGDDARPLPTAKVVMGMDISPTTLPPNIPDKVWSLWQEGKHQEALGLLYRGAISRVIHIGRVDIQESDTEGDCMRRVEEVGATASPDYFRAVTRTWMRVAYAGKIPAENEVQAMCRDWPFGEGGRA